MLVFNRFIRRQKEKTNAGKQMQDHRQEFSFIDDSSTFL